MSTENKVIDLTVEENVQFSMVLQFENVEDQVYASETVVPIDLTGYTFRGAIKDSLETSAVLLETFAITIVSATQGVVGITLTKAQTTNLSAKASGVRDRYNPRLRFAGYYDIIMSKTGSTSDFRVIEGKVLISDGVTT